ncbi:MAG: DUF5682 family protein [Myxococcota bacterium]
MADAAARWAAAKARVDEVLAGELYWFPVRHHSPNTARHLRAAIEARKPRLLLIEGPADATELVRYVVHPKTKPPVAIYSSYRDDDNVLGLNGVASPAEDLPARFSSWYPLLPYSPEYVAMQAAAKAKAAVVFVDLPHYALIRGAGDEAPPAEARLDDDALIATSSFYQQLADAAGYRAFDEAWDALFEVGERHADHEAFRHDLAWFCAAARATTDPARIAADGTLDRERHMWRAIQQALAEHRCAPSDAMVVCGGFHLLLDPTDDTPPPALPAGTVYNTVAPFSYFRTSELSGYGAGNRAPRYYEALWDALRAGETPDEAMVAHLVSVLARGRKLGEALSSADAVSVAQTARMLASLRGRKHARFDDLQDAVVTCCCKGDPREEGRHLLKAIGEASIGSAVGRVTPELGRLPLVHDFYAQIDALGLEDTVGRDARVDLEVDRRDPLGARRSAFLHRLLQLGVPLATRDDRTAGGTLFKEKWRARWSPKVEQVLIERNLYGDAVEAAAVAMLEEEIARDPAHASAVTALWRKAVDMDLPALALRMEATCGAAIDTDRRLASLARAFVDLDVLRKHAAFRGLRRDLLDDLWVRAFRRACFTVPEAADLPEEEHPELIGALSALAESLLAQPDVLDRALFTTNLRSAAAATGSQTLRGVFLGVLAEIRELPPEDLAAEVAAFARARPEVLVEAGAFLDGVLAVSRTSVMLGAEALVDALDQLLRAAEWEVFVTMLPRLRHAFERLHARQRDAVAERVAVRYGLRDGEALVTLETSVGAALALAAVDRRVGQIMSQWPF